MKTVRWYPGLRIRWIEGRVIYLDYAVAIRIDWYGKRVWHIDPADCVERYFTISSFDLKSCGGIIVTAVTGKAITLPEQRG